MRIGLLSDTHDNVENVRAALTVFAREGVSTLLHAGDVCGPAVVEVLAGFDVTFARGNMDRSDSLGPAVERLHGAGRLARCHELVLDGFRVALLHGDDEEQLGRLVHLSGCAYVVHGHTHQRADVRVAATRVLNPGALGGAGRVRSVCLLDLGTGEVRFVEIGRSGARAIDKGTGWGTYGFSTT